MGWQHGGLDDGQRMGARGEVEDDLDVSRRYCYGDVDHGCSITDVPTWLERDPACSIVTADIVG